MNMPGSSERLGFLSELYEWVIATDHSLPKFQGPSSGFSFQLKLGKMTNKNITVVWVGHRNKNPTTVDG